MKKFLLAILVLGISSGFAQSNSSELVDLLEAGVPYTCFNSTDGNLYLYYSPRYGTTDKCIRMPLDGGECLSKKMEHPSDYLLLSCFESANSLHCIYNFFDYKAKSYGIYMNTVPKDSETFSWNPELVGSIPLERAYDVRTYTSTSPDKTKAAVLLCLTQNSLKSASLKGSLILAFDEDGLLWQSPLDLEFTNNTLQIFNFSVNNDADVFTSILSFTKKDDKDKSRLDETLHLYQYGQYGEINHIDVQPEFGSLQSACLLFTRDGNIALSGYYSPAPDQKESGCYVYKFDTKNHTYTNISHNDFPSDYYAYTHLGTSKTTGKEFHAYPMEFYEFSDGSLALLGDMQSIMRSTIEITLGGNVLVHFINPNGDIVNFKMINKSQTSTFTGTPKGLRDRMFSYYPMMHNDVIHVIFADNVKNYKGESGQNCFIDAGFVSTVKYNGICATHCTIQRNQEISAPELLMDYTALKSYILCPLFADDDGFILCRTSKKANLISKLMYTMNKRDN
jgi:hypothetical protein